MYHFTGPLDSRTKRKRPWATPYQCSTKGRKRGVVGRSRCPSNLAFKNQISIAPLARPARTDHRPHPQDRRAGPILKSYSTTHAPAAQIRSQQQRQRSTQPKSNASAKPRPQRPTNSASFPIIVWTFSSFATSRRKSEHLAGIAAFSRAVSYRRLEIRVGDHDLLCTIREHGFRESKADARGGFSLARGACIIDRPIASKAINQSLGQYPRTQRVREMQF